MGLLMSETLLIEPTLDDALRLRDGLSEWGYALDARCDGSEHEAVDPSEWPTMTFWSPALATDAEH